MSRTPAIASVSAAPTGPLAVALDVLVASPVAHEALVRRVRGRTLEAKGLPYREEVLERLRAAKAEGRPVWLVAGEHGELAAGVAAHLGVFDEVVGAAQIGAAELVAAPVRRSPWKALPKALRVHQWAKNVLVFVPALTAHRLGPGHAPWELALAVATFCLCASAVYLLNDLADLDSDRVHRSKKRRPLAAGTFPILGAVALAPVLVAAAFGGAAVLGRDFTAVLATYLATTTVYSFWLKREAILDVVCLAGLYTLRIFAGSTAADVTLSPWLLAFSMFVFLSLALVKRVSELRAMPVDAQAVPGRGYARSDAELLLPLGVACAGLAVLVFALWIHLGGVGALYARPQVLWLLCPLLFSWLARAWLLTHRGQMHDDPVEFAARDRTSWAYGVVAALLVWMAT